MRVLFTGQTGIDKKRHLEGLAAFSARKGMSVDAVYSVGDIMYEESEKAGMPVKEGKILDLPLAQLNSLRRLAFTRISYESASTHHVFVNSHGVFRWNNKLFRAFELPELEGFNPDLIITLIDDVDAVKVRLDELKKSGSLPQDTTYSLKDIMVWREEEILASEMMAAVLRVPHYVLGVWLDPAVALYPMEIAFNLMFEPWKKRAYISFPISGAQARPEVWDKVMRFRAATRTYLTAFDPLMIGENHLQGKMLRLREEHPEARDLVCDVRGSEVNLSIQEIEAVVGDIDGQIVARDYKLIDQSEMIVAYFPRDSDGAPLIAAGVQSELEHAAASTKEVLVVWEAERDPTPFIGQKVDRSFKSIEELDGYLKSISQRPGQLEMPME